MAEEKIKITFNRDYEVKDGTGTKYKKGETKQFNKRSADHFLNRGVADLYQAPTKTDTTK